MKIKRYTLLPLFFYTILSLLTIYSTGGFNNVMITTDFYHYHAFWHEYLDLNLSNLSNSLYESSSKSNWLPNPFYSIIALFPITIFGSPALLKFIGFGLGCLYISLLAKFNEKINYKLNFWQLNVFLILISTNRWFIKESLGLGSVFCTALFFCLGITFSKPFMKIIFFSFALMCRPNFILFFIPFSVLLFFYDVTKKNSLSNLSKSTIIPLIIYPLWYLLVDSNYPGSNLNYIFLSQSQGIDWAHQYLKDIIMQKNQFLLPNKIISWDLGFNEFFRIILSDISILCSLIQIYFLKLFAFIGMRFEYAFLQKYNAYWQLSELWILIHFLFILLPGFIFSFIFTILMKKNNLEFTFYFSSIFYALSTSIFVGDPRYSVIILPILIYSLLRGILVLNKSSFLADTNIS